MTSVPFDLQVTIVSVKILYMSLIQSQELTGTTIPTIKESLSPRSATINYVPTGTTTSHAFGLQDAFGEKTTQALTSHGREHSYLKSTGSSTISIQTLNLHDLSLLHSFLLSPTLLGFPPSHSLKQVPALQYNNSASEEVAGCTCACKPLQRLFRPYLKLTPHPHLYLRLRVKNPYYEIKSMFNTSTNPQLHRLHKPTF